MTEQTAPAAGALDDLGAALADLVAATREHDEAIVGELRRLADRLEQPPAPAPAPQRDPSLLPGGIPHIEMRDRFVARWWDDRLTKSENERRIRGYFELARMLMDGARQLRVGPIDIRPSEEFEAAWRHWVFERGPRVEVVTEAVSDSMERAPRTRTMDTGESGYGQQLVGAQYVSELWAAARRRDGLLDAIPTLQMAAPTVYVPVDGGLPQMFFVDENGGDSPTPYPDTKTGSNRVMLTARKFTIQQRWTAELQEDSIIAFVPFLQDKLAESAALHIGSAILNGDTTVAATGNINSDDATPPANRHYLAWDGIRHYWLVDDPANGIDGGGNNPTAAGIIGARMRMAGAGNSVGTLDNIDWATDPANLRIVCNPGVYSRLLMLPEVVTLEKYGASATIVTGELGRIFGIPIIAPAYCTKTEADGKLSATPANNTLGQLSVVNVRGWLRGIYRPVQLFFDRVQRTDTFLVELYTRQALVRWGGDVAAGIRNLASD